MGHVEGTNLAWALHGLKPLGKGTSRGGHRSLCPGPGRVPQDLFTSLGDAPLRRQIGHGEGHLQLVPGQLQPGLPGCAQVQGQAILRPLGLEPGNRRFQNGLSIGLSQGTDYVSYPSTGSGQAQVQPGTHKAVPPPSSWDAGEVPSLYSRFLETYCSEVGFNFKEEDHRLIDCFTRANIKRSQDTSRKDKFH